MKGYLRTKMGKTSIEEKVRHDKVRKVFVCLKCSHEWPEFSRRFCPMCKIEKGSK